MKVGKKAVQIIGLLLLAVSLMFALSGCGEKSKATTGQGENKSPVVLKLSYAMPATAFQGQTYEYFAKLVKEESKGQVEIQTYPAGSLVSDPEILDAVAAGNVDIGHFMVAYVSPTIKELTPLEIPGAYPGSKVLELEKATRPVVETIFEKYGIKYLGCNVVGEISFSATKNAGKPIKIPSDMKGLAVRTPGKWGAEAIKLWGGSPVTVPLGDLPVALERNTINVAYTGWVINSGLKLYESTPFVTFTDLQEMFQGLIMSDKAWKKLNAEQQGAVMRAVKRWQDYAQQTNTEIKQKYEGTLKGAGVTVYYLTDSENAEFKKVTEPLMDQIKAISGADGEKLINAFKSLR